MEFTTQEYKDKQRDALAWEMSGLARNAGMPAAFGDAIDWLAIADNGSARFKMEHSIDTQLSTLNEMRDKLALISQLNESCGITLFMLHLGLGPAQVTDEVVFDYLDEKRYPSMHLDSYRGYHRHAALGNSSDPVQAGAFHDMIQRNMRGGYVHGYKGGDFRLYPQTQVWAALWGDASRRAVTGVRCEPGQVVLETAIIEPQ